MPKVKITRVPKAQQGLQVEGNKFTPFTESAFMINGNSHENGGTKLSYMGNTVEAEAGEPGFISKKTGDLTIMGNMHNPLTGNKFKTDAKVLMTKEQKVNKLMDYSTALVNNSNPYNKWDRLKFNSGNAMMIGANIKKKELEQSKEHLGDVQQAMLDISDELGVDPHKFSQGKFEAKKGLTMKNSYQVGGTVGPWDYRGTNTKGIDPKITDFIGLLQKKGYTGFSGPESGVSRRNTKSGRASRHQSGEALDAFLSQPDAYNKVLQDPELSKYLIDNGLTVLNEYDPNVAKQTGATAGHLHIGYDKGTGVSDQFRQDAAKTYKATNPNWGWGTLRNPKGKTVPGAPVGDQQSFPYSGGYVDENQTFAPPPDNTQRIKPGGQYDFQLRDPKKYDVPTDTKGLSFDQIVPELYAAATNRREPVFAQKYQPELFEPYQVSFQDRRNLNNQTFRAVSQKLTDNPGSLATLAAQKYEADNQVNAEEFRTNQTINNEITNKNVGLLNDAQGKNLQIADTQYIRASQAKSNTKAVNQAVVTSISGKLAQNRLENKTLQVYENLYPHYRYDENYQLQKEGAPGGEYLNTSGFAPGTGGNSTAPGYDSRTRVNYDSSNKMKGYTRINPSELDTATKQVKLQNEQEKSLQYLFNDKKFKVPRF